MNPYLLAGIGPHYISVHSEQQAWGFIFSDNLGVGLQFFATPHQSFDIGYRFRHISTAGLAEPNLGINTHNWYIGYRKRYSHRF